MVKHKKLLLRCVDDSVMIMSFVLDDGYFIKREGTKEEIEAEILKSSTMFPPERLPIVSWEEIEDESILQDRTFRNAWKHEGHKGRFGVDMPKARDIHREHLRRKRLPVFCKLDTDYMIAEENDDIKKKKEIAAKKQKLRDITTHPSIELAQTPEELKIVGFDEILNINKQED